MKTENQLTQEFWNKLFEKYPGEISELRHWIDEYKKRVDWNDLFWNAGQNRVAYWSDIKFHHLPDAMQAGLLIQYVLETKGAHRYSLVFDTEQMHLGEKSTSAKTYAEIIEEWFCEEHSTALQKHQEAKNGEQ